MFEQPLFLGPLPVDTFEPTKIFEVKTENLFAGRLIVEKHLPLELAQAVFARPGTHDIAVRLEATSSTLAMTIGSIATGALKLATTEPTTPNHPMDAIYYSQVPLRHGDQLVDFCIVPSSPGLLALKRHPFSPENPIALREATLAFFQYNPAQFDFKIKVDTGTEITGADGHTTRCMEYRTIAHVIIPARITSESAIESLALATAHTLAA